MGQAIRITVSGVKKLTAGLNKIAGQPLDEWTVKGSQNKANIGHYRLGFAYGAVRLEQIVDEDGSIRDVLGVGYLPRRELYQKIQAYISNQGFGG